MRKANKPSSPSPSKPRPRGAQSRSPMGRVIALLVTLVVAAAVVGLGWRLWPASRSLKPGIELPAGAAAGYNVLLITLDTTRSDRIGCYGYAAAQTPVLDKLAADGVRCADAICPVPMTLPAHASILTGQYPPRLGVRDNGVYRLAAEHETLAEQLAAQGYASAAFIAAFVMERRYGLDQGFQTYADAFQPERADQLNPQRPANQVVDETLAWFDAPERAAAAAPFFAWVHLFDPHTPYAPPEPLRSRFANRPYDGELAFVDQQIGRLLDGLRVRHKLERTLVVVVGDHGEGLGDHGESTHSLLIYESTMSVPLIFYAPQLLRRTGVVADRVVSTVDVAPTILDLLGIPVPAGLDGVSLLRSAPRDRLLYMETLATRLNHGWSPLHGLRRERLKYIEAPTPELYDLAADPRETRNLVVDRPEEARELARALAGWMESFPGSGAAPTLELDAQARRQLEALGYVGGGAATTSGPLPDPKEMIARSDEHMRRASELLTSNPAEAIRLVKDLLANSPNDAGLWSMLSAAQAQLNQLDDAIAARLRTLELQPNDPTGWVLLAKMQEANGDREGSRVSLAEAERLDPQLGSVFIVRAIQAFRDQRFDEALELAREAGRRDPTRYGRDSWALQAEILKAAGRPAEAKAAEERARGPQPP